jgi:hypothetical protein
MTKVCSSLNKRYRKQISILRRKSKSRLFVKSPAFKKQARKVEKLHNTMVHKQCSYIGLKK